MSTFNPETIIEEAQEAYKFDVPRYTPDWVNKVIRAAIIKAYNAGLKQALEVCDASSDQLMYKSASQLITPHLIKE